MSSGKVADFSAFLSVTTDGESEFETREGRVVITREEVAVAGEGQTRQLSLDAITGFDFRTVPDGWEQFFDDLVGIRFETSDEVVIVTVGTDTTVADRFVTVLLKLILEGATATVRQQRFPRDGGETTHSSGESKITLRPRSEQIRFGECDVRAIDILTVTDFTDDKSESTVVRHLSADGRTSTEVTFDEPRDSQFFRTYLEFRSELAARAGPVRFVYLGEDRDTLVLVAKLLKHRQLAFEAGHASTAAELFETLDSATFETECLVVEDELSETGLSDLRDRLVDLEYHLPLVVLSRNDASALAPEDVADVVDVDSRTEHYEDVANAIERVAREGRTS